MLCLALDASSQAASVALATEDRLLGEIHIRNGLKHSQTLLPMIDDCLRLCDTTMADVGLIACAAGPGSFTGVRIAVATAMGLAQRVPVAGVNTLEALAAQAAFFPGIVCAALDARARQVYCAAYREGESLLPPRPLPVDDLLAELAEYEEPILFVGDGAEAYTQALSPLGTVAPAPLLGVHAAFVASLALQRPETWGDAAALRPIYLRAPQAERARLGDV